MLKACRAVGRHITVQHACMILRNLAQGQSDLLVKVDSRRWPYRHRAHRMTTSPAKEPRSAWAIPPCGNRHALLPQSIAWLRACHRLLSVDVAIGGVKWFVQLKAKAAQRLRSTRAVRRRTCGRVKARGCCRM